MGEINKRGKDLLALAFEEARAVKKVKELTARVKEIRDPETILSKTDLNALAKGKLTGDPALDAAILLSMSHLRRNKGLSWVYGVKLTYDAIVKAQKAVQKSKSGLILYDTSNKYFTHLDVGVIQDPELQISFDKDFYRNVKINVAAFEYQQAFHIQFARPRLEVSDRTEYYSDSLIDVTQHFESLDEKTLKPLGLDYRTPDFARVLCFGKRAIKKYVQELRNPARERPDTVEATEKLVDKVNALLKAA